MEQALKETFMKMDVLLLTPEGKKELSAIKNDKEEGSSFQNDSFAGCTANVALIHRNVLYVANAGDSRCVIGCNNDLVRMSVDHKPDSEIEKQRIIKAGGFVTEGRVNANLNLSRAIGDLEYKKNNDLTQDKQLIIACPDVTQRVLTKNVNLLFLFYFFRLSL